MQKMLCTQVLELLDLFASHGHSGFSAPHAVQLFTKLAAFKLIAPLTGEDDEWNQPSDRDFEAVQNNRLSSVFKDADGRAYDIDGRVYWEWCKNEEGDVFKSYFHKGGDKFYIEFPYVQKKAVAVFVPSDEYPNPHHIKEEL